MKVNTKKYKVISGRNYYDFFLTESYVKPRQKVFVKKDLSTKKLTTDN